MFLRRIALRNRHMREKYLEVEKYPDAVLRVPLSAIRLPAEGASTGGSPAGEMSIHGKTQSVPFTYQASRQGNTYSVTGSLNLNFNDFGIELPTYLGVTLKPDIVLNTKFVAKGG